MSRVRVCPLCGGDLVEWSEDVGVRNGFDTVLEYRGCTKVRDKGAGESDDGRPHWSAHYAEIRAVTTAARFR